MYVRYDLTTPNYLVGVYNGHTVPIAENPCATPILKHTAYCHATSWGSTVEIVKAGIRSMSGNDIRLVPLHMSARQQVYLAPSIRKTHVVTVDGVMAAPDGIKFLEVDNGVIATRGINGLIHPCCITGIWPNTNMGRRCLSLDKAKAAPPEVAPTTEMPDLGPQ